MKKALPIRSPFPLITACAILAVMGACQKNSLEKFYPNRMFTPATISIAGGDTAVVINWSASLNAPVTGVSYTVEISTDSTFQATPVLSFTVDSVAVRVTDDSLEDRTPYFVRVKANANGNAADSYWIKDTVRFSLIGVQIFQSLKTSDIIDNAVILHWRPTPEVNLIVLTGPGGDTTQIPVSEADNQQGQKLISGLEAGTSYSVQILAGKKSKGLLSFTTQTRQTGDNVVDLRASADPKVLFDTLSVIPAGSIVLLARGMTYSMPTYVIDKPVTIMSGLGFGDPAVIALSGNFDASGDIDSIHFKDLTLAAAGGSYFMNVGNTAHIKQMTVENVTTSGPFNNSFIRLKTAGDVIDNLHILNCVIDSIGIETKYAVLYANASSSALIDHLDIRNSTFYDIYYFVRQDGVSPSALTIDGCTFNDFINNSGYFVNYSGTFPPSFTISNCIFGATLDPAKSNGIKSSGGAQFSNCYMTSDCVFSANPLTGPISYKGSSTDLFSSPQTGIFSFKDGSFAGSKTAGDPRWRN